MFSFFSGFYRLICKVTTHPYTIQVQVSLTVEFIWNPVVKIESKLTLIPKGFCKLTHPYTIPAPSELKALECI